MKGNSIWFNSPSKNDSLQPSIFLKTEDPQPEDMLWIKPIFFSPESITPIFNQSNLHNPLSTMPKHITSQQIVQQRHFSIQKNLSQQNQMVQEINQKIEFSQNEEQQGTSIKKEQNKLNQPHLGYFQTKGNKSPVSKDFKNIRSFRKGLRALSQRSYQIVQQMGNTTYKQVANILIKELKQEYQDKDKKQEMNIKRRVYDALNVLIALGALQKDGNRIKTRSPKKNNKPTFFDSDQKENLQLSIQIKQSSNEQKRRTLQEIKYKFELINFLLQRNRNKNIINQLTIPFPFVGMCIDKFEFEKSKKQNKNEFYLKSGDRMQPFGDIDSIKFLRESLQRLAINQQSLIQDYFSSKIEKEEAY